LRSNDYAHAVDVSWLLVAVAYFVGTLPSATFVGSVVGHDPTREGSRNPGASNMYRIAGRNAGAIVLVADVLKGALPVLVGLAAGGRALGIACGLAAILGHIFPATRSFRGGKGVATYGGVTLACWLPAGICGLATWLIVLRLTKTPSLGALIAIPITVLVVFAIGRPNWEVAAAALAAALIIARHHRNIARLLQSEELRVGN